MSYKALFAIASTLDLEIKQLDIQITFLYNNIDKKIFVKQPHSQENGTTCIYQLNKALYRLKQAPQIWFFTFAIFLKELGLLPLSANFAVFSWENTFIKVYVDNMFIVRPFASQIKEIK